MDAISFILSSICNYAPIERWLAQQSPAVQRLARSYGAFTVIDADSQSWYLVGYRAPDILVMSMVSPWADYERAVLPENRRYFQLATSTRSKNV